MAASSDGSSRSLTHAIHIGADGRAYLARPFRWSDRLPTTAQQRADGPPINEARRAFANGDLATAERICSQLLAGTPDDGTAWALLTETALQRGRPDAAIVCANRAVGLMPKDPID